MRARDRTSRPPPDPCPLDATLDFLSSRWVPKILWFLCQGPMRFGELKRALGTISPKVLTARLREMEADGVIDRRVLHTSARQVQYSLTELGHEFRPVFEAISMVGSRLRRHTRPEMHQPRAAVRA